MNQNGENNANWKGGRSKNHYYYTKRSKQKYPEKDIARKQVYRAIRSGKLKKPDFCQHRNCFESEIFAHHIDYTKPLAVEWFCRKHHFEADKEQRQKEIKNNKCKNVENRKSHSTNQFLQSELFAN